MWPKLLLELLPHFTRLVPLADRYFSSRGDQDKAHTAALASLSEEVRSGLGRVDEVHAGLQQELKAQGEQIAELGVEATRARMAVESLEQRMAKLERTAQTARRIAIATLVLAAATTVIGGIIVFELWVIRAP